MVGWRYSDWFFLKKKLLFLQINSMNIALEYEFVKLDLYFCS